jgi:type IV pilus assembly protein PilV
MRQINHAGRHDGFSLVEVMVALLIISIGLLGIAKMQALAISTTGSARLRSLGALEAASLASMMRADRTYWASSATTATPLSIVIKGPNIFSSSDGNINVTPPDCSMASGGLCTTPAQMANYDLGNWATAVNTVIQNEYATISCQQPAPVAPVPAEPVTCSISIAWAESNGPASLATPQYTVVVQP